MFQSALDPRTIQTALRVVKNSYTATLTITAGTIALNTPVIIETHSASLPQTTTNSSTIQQWGRRPATSTSVANNLLQGLLAKVPGTKVYLDREEVGLVLCYGIDPLAVVQLTTADQLAGQPLIPESLQFLVSVTGPVTAAATGTAANVEVPGLGGLMYLIGSVASSSATSTARAPVFVRCM